MSSPQQTAEPAMDPNGCCTPGPMEGMPSMGGGCCAGNPLEPSGDLTNLSEEASMLATTPQI